MLLLLLHIKGVEINVGIKSILALGISTTELYRKLVNVKARYQECFANKPVLGDCRSGPKRSTSHCKSAPLC